MAKSIKDTLKSFGSNESEFEFSNTIGTVAESFEDLIEKLKDNLRKAKHGDDEKHSQLLQSVVALPSFLGSKIIIEVKFEDYGLDVDKGTKPKGYNSANLKELTPKIADWISRRPKLIRASQEFQRKYRIKKTETARKSFTFLLTRAVLKRGTIKRFGYKGSNWFSKEIKNGGRTWEKQLKEKIAKALGQDVRIEFKIIAESFK